MLEKIYAAIRMISRIIVFFMLFLLMGKIMPRLAQLATSAWAAISDIYQKITGAAGSLINFITS